LRVGAADHVERGRAEERADHDVGEHGVEGVADGGAAEEIFERPGPEDLRDLPRVGLRGDVDPLERLDPVDQLPQRRRRAFLGHGH